MSNRQLFLGIAGALLMVIGLLALWFPVYLSQYDQYGMQIACGSGFSANLSQAADANGDGLVAQCGTALLLRRIWAIPVLVLGWLILTVLIASWVRAKPSAEESSRFWELSGDST
ncbi:MAG: hypothetical protein WAN71_02410 [Mycobacterium sp.]|uniref:hypothetical protein n=1 Tax=Mycobacterium sp. TaxID=1785 RepID=UPI003BB02663